MNSALPPPLASDLVLIGGGHAHVHVLKMLGMPPYREQLEQAGIRVTLVTNTLLTPYSGMLPGYLAGHYTYEEIHLDLHKICRFANIRLIHGAAEAITYGGDSSGSTGRGASGGWITVRDVVTGELRPPVRYDCLSIDIGITPSTLPNHTTNVNSVIPVKPIASFCTHYQQLQQRVLQQIQISSSTTVSDKPKKEQEEPLPAALLELPTGLKPALFARDDDNDKGGAISSTDPFTILVVGGGAGGIEVALSVQHRLRELLQVHVRSAHSQRPPPSADHVSISSKIKIILATRGTKLLEEHNAQVQRTMLRVLQERNIQVRYGADIVSVQELPPPSHNPNGRVKTIAILSTPASSQNTNASSSSSSHNNDSKYYNPLVSTTSTNTTIPASNENSQMIECDECVWCTSAVAPSWLSTHTPFACTETGGFIKVKSTLQCVDHPGVFAAGDCCYMTHAPRPKAGVFAVRSGPVLLHNVLSYLLYDVKNDRHLLHYFPQKTFLGLISTGDDYAIASKGKYFCIQGKWVWTWKDYIDRKFMSKYQDDLADLHHDMMQRHVQQQRHFTFWKTLQQLLQWATSTTTTTTTPRHVQAKGSHVLQAFTASDPMRCGGCGAKIGSSTLSRVLAAIQQRQATRNQGKNRKSAASLKHDDVAVVPLPSNSSGGNMLYTIDYFRSMVSDPYLFGKVCAIHALSDIHAMGVATTSTPYNDDDDDSQTKIPSITALALCVVPFCADESLTESTLMDLLSGGSDVLQDEHVQLVGGHSCEGMELACGFSLQGFVPPQMALFRKRGGRIGDKLVLTKAVGTGALMAADMRVKIKAAWMEEGLASMLRSNGPASRIAARVAAAAAAGHCSSIHACTDVTGFGLIGHLLEMLMANEEQPDDDDRQQEQQPLESIGAKIHLQAIPILQGALAASSLEIYSSLQVSNLHNRRAVSNHTEAATVDPIRYPLLFDPQTAGGLLFFVDPNVCHEFVSDLHQYYPDVSVIGELVAYHCDEVKTNNVLDEDLGNKSVCTTVGSGGRTTGTRIHIVL